MAGNEKASGMIYHIVSEADYRSHNDGQQYLPADFVADGFVHCALEGSVLAQARRGDRVIAAPLS